MSRATIWPASDSNKQGCRHMREGVQGQLRRRGGQVHTPRAQHAVAVSPPVDASTAWPLRRRQRQPVTCPPHLATCAALQCLCCTRIAERGAWGQGGWKPEGPLQLPGRPSDPAHSALEWVRGCSPAPPQYKVCLTLLAALTGTRCMPLNTRHPAGRSTTACLRPACCGGRVCRPLTCTWWAPSAADPQPSSWHSVQPREQTWRRTGARARAGASARK
jgi:hypothetical protein